MNYKQDQLMIDVIDSGVGLSHELDEHIFEKGYSSKGENRGYGLHLVQQSVEKLDGQISINAHEAEMYSSQLL